MAIFHLTFTGLLLILSRIKIYSMEKREIMSKIQKNGNEIIPDMKIDIDNPIMMFFQYFLPYVLY